jgi:pimeloyl-ACP methyl ester carboxylesterase
MMKLLHSQILGEGKPLLILHGFMGMGDNWKSLANSFATLFEVHLIDQRNHGRSFHSDDFSYELMVEDLVYYMDQHGLDKAHMLGHSMGGKTVMLMAIEHPERVDHLIVADIAPKFYPPHHQYILEALNAVDFSSVSSRNEIDEILQRYIPEPGIRQFLLKNVYRKNRDELAYRFNLHSLEENIDEIGVELPPHAMAETPTLFLRGVNSGYITERDRPLIKAHFPMSEIVDIADAGHWLHAENPDDFYKSVVRFLENR